MTKAQLLAALEAKDFVDAVGTPELLETKPDGTKWYGVNIREIKGTEGVYRNVYFYVVDEGGGGEVAYFKDEPPSQSVRNRALYEWMQGAIDGAPDNYKAAQIHWVSERYEMVVFSILDTSGADLVWQAYYIRRGGGAKVKITNHEAWRLSSIFNR